MAIFFNCTCGQDLRADERDEGGHTECPACGDVVPIPSLAQVNERLGIKSVLWLELPARLPPPVVPPRSQCAALPDPAPSPKARAARLTDEAEPPTYPLQPQTAASSAEVWCDLEREEVRRVVDRAGDTLASWKGRGPGCPLETIWLECLLYPLRAWMILVGLALVWAMLAAIVSEVLAEAWEPVWWDAAALWWQIPLAMLAFLLLGYACAFFRCVLASGAAGEAGFVSWPGADILQVLWSGAACLVCFLAGPAVLVALAYWFWLNNGDPTWVDLFILWELGLVAVGYWALALLAVDQSGRLRDANPVGVIRLVVCLGWRGRLAVVLATVGTLAGFYFTWGAVAAVHHGPLGFMGLIWWGFCGQVWIVFLLRWVGVSRFWADERRNRERQGAFSDGQRHAASRVQEVPESIPPDHMMVG
jgi:hypothetical protein